jgi:branched-subunit amino acid ABC-type transport system permease component
MVVVCCCCTISQSHPLRQGGAGDGGQPAGGALVGINTRFVVGFSFGVSAAIGALAGILMTPITLTSYDVGTMLALKGFAAAMLGGMGNPVGAVLGGAAGRPAGGVVGRAYKLQLQGRRRLHRHLLVLFAMPNGLAGIGISRGCEPCAICRHDTRFC